MRDVTENLSPSTLFARGTREPSTPRVHRHTPPWKPFRPVKTASPKTAYPTPLFVPGRSTMRASRTIAQHPPPPSLAHLSTLRALCLAQLDLAIPLLPLSLSPRAREILFGALFSTRRSRFSLPRWLTGSARVNWHRAMSDTVDASVDGRGWLGEYFWD